jgi:hypothetical protein
MAPSDPVRDALKALKQRRQELNAELKRVDQALSALTGLSDQEGRSGARPKGAPSVRQMLLTLLTEWGARDWSVAEILEAYQRKGTPIHGSRPENALRAAIADAYRGGQIIRTAQGRYRITPPPPEIATETTEGYGFDEEPF